jgi:hypothetical protein
VLVQTAPRALCGLVATVCDARGMLVDAHR